MDESGKDFEADQIETVNPCKKVQTRQSLWCKTKIGSVWIMFSTCTPIMNASVAVMTHD